MMLNTYIDGCRNSRCVMSTSLPMIARCKMKEYFADVPKKCTELTCSFLEVWDGAIHVTLKTII